MYYGFTIIQQALVKDYHLPWQKPQVKLTPGRVAQSMFGLLVEIGIPAIAPKPRGFFGLSYAMDGGYKE